MYQQTSTVRAIPRLLLGVLLATTSFACEAAKAPVSPGGVSAAVTIATTSIGPLRPAQFEFSPTAPTTGQSVSFNAAGSAAGPGQHITSYSWDFGDGKTGAGVTVAHSYGVPGTYVVVLVVTDDAAQRATKSAAVPVTAGASTTNASLQYVNAQGPPDGPSDITVGVEATSNGRFDVRGTFNTPSGIGGVVDGVFTGALQPVLSGTFAGVLKYEQARCTDEARFSGPMDQNMLTWRRDAIVNDCSGAGASPLAAPGFASFTLLLAQKPPTPSTTTTSIAPPATTSSSTTTSMPPSGAVSGTVTDASTGDAIEGVIINAVSVGPGGSGFTATSALGLYQLPLPTGTYSVLAQKVGYVSKSQAITVVQDKAAIADFSLVKSSSQ